MPRRPAQRGSRPCHATAAGGGRPAPEFGRCRTPCARFCPRAAVRADRASPWQRLSSPYRGSRRPHKFGKFRAGLWDCRIAAKQIVAGTIQGYLIQPVAAGGPSDGKARALAAVGRVVGLHQKISLCLNFPAGIVRDPRDRARPLHIAVRANPVSDRARRYLNMRHRAAGC
jgi:hypothetical protein